MNDPELPVKEDVSSALQDLRKNISQHNAMSSKTSIRHKKKSSPMDEIRREIIEDEDEEDVGYSQPRRSWFTSTAFPLIAGTFGPLASLFSISAIVEGWRVSVPEGGIESEGTPVRDPPWLTALNAISLVLALIANLVLLFNFAHRIRYAVAQPITITLWYISGIILVVLLCLTRHINVPSPTNQITPHTDFSQSYYSAIISAVLYLVLSTLLLINLCTSSPFPYFSQTRALSKFNQRKSALTHPPSFAPLTIPQRTLMLQSTFLTIYLGIGGIIFSALQRGQVSPLTPSSQNPPNYNETMTFPSALYFADYTLLTVGLGSDFPLQTPQARGVLIPYALGGILLIGLVVGSVRGLVVERGRVKSWRRTVWKELVKERDYIRQTGTSKREVRHGVWSKWIGPSKSGNFGHVTTWWRKWRGGGEVDVDVEVKVGGEHPHETGEDNDGRADGDWEKKATVKWGEDEQGFQEGQGKEAFYAMRRAEDRAERRQNSFNALNALLAYLIVWFGGALVFYFTEKPQEWTYGTALYFTYVSLLTIGYGDLTPQSNSGRPFYIIWSLVAVPAVTIFVSAVGTIIVSGIKHSILWIGERTILPEKSKSEKGEGAEVEAGLRRMFGVQGGYGMNKDRHVGRSHQHRDATDTEEDQDQDQEENRNIPQPRLKVRLAQEISRLVDQIAKNGGRKHDWNEWERWLDLLAAKDDEQAYESENLKAQQLDGGAAMESNQSQVGSGRIQQCEGDQGPSTSDSKEEGTMNRSKSEQEGSKPKVDWAWLGDNGPLFSGVSETEWVLGRLCGKLEVLLGSKDENRRGEHDDTGLIKEEDKR